MSTNLILKGTLKNVEVGVARTDESIAYSLANSTEQTKSYHQVSAGSTLEIELDTEADFVLIKSTKTIKLLTDSDASARSVTFTAATSDLLTFPSNPRWWTGKAVTLTTTGTLPAGLSLNTTYYLISKGLLTAELASSLSNAEADTPVDITNTGSGTHTITEVDDSYSDDIDQAAQGTMFMIAGSNAKRLFIKNSSSETAEVRVLTYF